MTVKLLDHMGSDLTVVNAARVSFNKRKEEFDERDEKLIHFLARNNHWTPFGHPQIQFRIKMPIFVARQWFRSNVGIVRNEVSRRYVDDAPEFFEPDVWRGRAKNKKQGSSEKVISLKDLSAWRSNEHPNKSERIFDDYSLQELYDELLERNNHLYNMLIANDVAPEQARMVLPQSTYTEFIETGSLAAYARVYNLRIDPHAQKEVQDYAKQIGELIQPLFPVSWEALTNK